MIELPELPGDSALSVYRGRNRLRVRWRSTAGASPRLASYVGLLLMPLVAVAATYPLTAGARLWPGVLAPSGFLLVAVVWAICLWRSLRRGRQATLVLGREAVTFVFPARLDLPRTGGITSLLLGTRVAKPGRGEIGVVDWGNRLEAQRSRRRIAVPRQDVTSVSPDDADGCVAVGTKGGGPRFGRDLGIADREWLSEVLRRWKAAA